MSERDDMEQAAVRQSSPQAVGQAAWQAELNGAGGTPAWPPAGWVDRHAAARVFGVAPDTLKGWYRTGRIRFGKDVAKPGGGRCKIYPIAELQRLKAQMAAEHGQLPAGFIGREEAARLFNLSVSGWKKWRHLPRVPAGTWAKVPGKRTLVKVYPLDALQRLREELAAVGELRPDGAEREAIELRRAAAEAAKVPPAGMIGTTESRQMFGVSKQTWRRWNQLGWVHGRKYGPHWYYDRAALAQRVAEYGKMSPPYPDADLPGVYRVVLRGTGMLRREALIDAESLPLIDGRFLNFSWDSNDHSSRGFVAISDARAPVVLRRIIMGVTDPELYVIHVNGDPLDCRRANLVVKTVAQHCQGNRKILARAGRPASSRFKGVCWEERTGSWVAQINVGGNRRRIGRFKDEIAAAEAYDEAALAAWGEHARLNFPDGIDAFLAAEAGGDADVEGDGAREAA